MPFIERSGARLYWRRDGRPELPALLLGNSLGTDQSLWDCLMPHLMQSFQVLRMDMRGHGASVLTANADATDWSIGLLAEDVLAVADAAGARRFHYAGISIGGMIGLWLGAHTPARVASMLVSNTSARLPDGVWPERIAQVRAGGMQALEHDTLQRWFTAGFAARQPALHATIRANFLATDTQAYAGCGAALRDMDLRPLLPGITVPTTVVAGREDNSTPPAMGRLIAAAVPGARYLEMQVAHIPHVEESAQFLDALEAATS